MTRPEADALVADIATYSSRIALGDTSEATVKAYVAACQEAISALSGPQGAAA